MKVLSSSPGMTTEPLSSSVCPHRAIMHSSLFLGICSIVCLAFSDAGHFGFGVSLGSLLVCVLPWLVAVRRRVWSRSYPEGGGWMKAVAILLWTSLLIGPVVTGSFWGWTRISDAPEGMLGLSNLLGVAVLGVISFSAAYYLATLAFLIQVWRDHWCKRLTGATIAFLFLLYVAYVWAVTS